MTEKHRYTQIRGSAGQLTELFKTTFAASEGEAEGQMVSDLVGDLMRRSDEEEVVCFSVREGESLLAAVLFTKLIYSDQVVGLLLSPMAVTPDKQGQGMGQKLIKHAIKKLSGGSESFVVTYGDPNFYSKVGFKPLQEARLPAPYPLSMPHGWLALSLTGSDLPHAQNRPTCASAFRNPEIW